MSTLLSGGGVDKYLNKLYNMKNVRSSDYRKCFVEVIQPTSMTKP